MQKGKILLPQRRVLTAFTVRCVHVEREETVAKTGLCGAATETVESENDKKIYERGWS